jgi:hypothetical protein
MIKVVATALSMLVAPLAGHAEESRAATLYKLPHCGCCEGHADHLRANGYQVTVVESETMSLIKKTHGVPQALEGCHTILIDGYVVEGHVPASVIDRLLEERPAIRGISLPGMPEGSPGMGGAKTEPFEIYEISEGAPTLYATE